MTKLKFFSEKLVILSEFQLIFLNKNSIIKIRNFRDFRKLGFVISQITQSDFWRSRNFANNPTKLRVYLTTLTRIPWCRQLYSKQKWGQFSPWTEKHGRASQLCHVKLKKKNETFTLEELYEAIYPNLPSKEVSLADNHSPIHETRDPYLFLTSFFNY